MLSLFENCESLKQIKIPESVVSIEDNAFSGCLLLTNVLIPSSVKTIGKKVFENCESLQQITIPESIQSIDDNAFLRCKSLKKIIISTSVQRIGNKIFKGCTSLTHITIPSSVQTIEKDTFEECFSLTNLTITNDGKNNLTIVSAAFDECKKLRNISINTKSLTIQNNNFNKINGIKSIEIDSDEVIINENCFNDSENLNKIIIKSKSLIKVGRSSFNKLKCLDFIEMHGNIIIYSEDCFNDSFNSEYESSDNRNISINSESTISISNNCFNNLKCIDSIEISCNDIKIDEKCFNDCFTCENNNSDPKHIKFISKSTIKIGESCFINLNYLNHIMITGNEITIENNSFNNGFNDKIIFPNMKNNITIDGKSAISIGNNCFCKYNCIKNIEMTGNGIVIGDNCFNSCFLVSSFSLTKYFVKLDSKSNIKLGSSFLNESKFLTSVEIIGTDVDINGQCCKGCESLSSFNINKAANIHFSNNEFDDCKNLKELFLLSSSKINILKNFLTNKSYIKKLEINSKQVIIEDYSFESCSSIVSFSIKQPKEISIYENTFHLCSNLKNISLQSSELIILFNSCFSGMKELESVNLSTPELIIGENCFYNCNRLNSTSFSNMILIQIGNNAFTNCISLSRMEFKASNSIVVGENCFLNAQKLESISFDSKVIEFGNRCFDSCNNLSFFSMKGIQLIQFCSNLFEKTSNVYINNVHSINGENFEIILKENGSINQIYQLEKKATNEKFTMIVSNDMHKIDSSIYSFMKMLETNYIFDNPAILSLAGFTFIKNGYKEFPTLITKFMPNGTLENAFSNNLLSSSQSYFILLGISLGVNRLLSQNIDFTLNPSNILLDENFLPYIYYFTSQVKSFDYFSPKKSNKNTSYSFSFSLIAYQLISKNEPIYDGKEYVFKCISDQTILQFLNRCKLNNVSFNEIFVEITKNKYMEYLETSEEEVIKYLDLFNIEPTEIIEQNLICYKLFKKRKLAEIVESPKANGSISISRFIEFNNSKYEIISINDNAFFNSQITSLKISPDSAIKSIGNFAFEKSNLIDLFIPMSVVEIKENCFFGAEKLSIINVDPKNDIFNIDENGILFNKNEKWKMILFARNFKGIFTPLPDIKYIGSYAFYGCKNLQSFICDSPIIESIGSHCFDQCDNLIEIKISKSYSLKIGSFCFSGLKQIKNIEIACENLILDENCFNNCTSLSAISFQNTKNITIGPNLFKGCNSLKQISIIKSKKANFSNCCFENCSKLQIIEVDCEELIIGENCFANYTLLTTLKLIVANTIKLNSKSFHGANNLKSISFVHASLIQIPDESFIHCKNLESINFEGEKINIGSSCFNEIESLKFACFNCSELLIGCKCFHKCINLESISFQNVKNAEFENYAFAYCQKLSKFKIVASENLKVEYCCFLNAKNLMDVKLAGGDLFISFDVFKNCSSLYWVSFESTYNYFISEETFRSCICRIDTSRLKKVNKW